MLRIVKLTLCVTLLAVSASSFATAEDSKKADEKKPASANAEKKVHPIYGQTMKSLTGKETKLSQFRGKVMLIVNVASECGATPQYDPLQGLHKKYTEKGLAVVGFPCNQFGKQDPGSNDEIMEFCQLNYGVSFPMFGKIEVNGSGADPLFKYLKKEAPGALGTQAIKWNFTKFLIDAEGNVVKRYAPTDKPAAIEKDVKKLLA